MQIAFDEKGKRVLAYAADKGNEYHWPLCKRIVNVCQGSIKEAYFAHHANDTCTDSWNYDMSEWHRSMQSRFPEKQREIIVSHGGITHRADVLCGNQIVEFQHSPISFEEIKERNAFYNAAGYSVAWVFDLQEQYDAGRISPCDHYNGLGYKWSYPKASLQCFPQPHEYDKKLVIHFYWINSDGEEEFNRVIWSKHDGGVPNFKEFIASDYPVYSESPDSPLKVSDFFITKRDRLQVHLSKLNCRYVIKYAGVRGHQRDAYICPRRPGVFGIKRYSERGCSYCRYCAAVKELPNGFESYCCYPNQIHEVDECHPGYECSGVPEF